MPYAWVEAGAAVYGAVNSGGGGGGGGGASGPAYSPYGLRSADTGWQTAFDQGNILANQATDTTRPAYQQSFDLQNNNPNWLGYLGAQGQAGQQYGQLAQTGQQQMGQYGQAAQTAQGQQQQLYGAGNQLWQTAQDPQHALYNRTQQQLTDQVRAGQAARGLGNSAVGASEENQAMGNFNIDWQNQQLQRQMTGLQGMSQASNAGGSQGQLYGADLAAQMQSGAQGAGYQQQAGAVPYQGYQFIAGQPAANAQQYQQELQGLQQMYGNQANQAIPYMNAGTGAQQFNSNFGAQQNAANTQALMTGIQGISNQANTPGSWMNNIFGGGGGGGGYASNAAVNNQNYNQTMAQTNADPTGLN